MADERLLAVELDRALAGEDVGDEARELAALLIAAAEPARFEVDDAEVEHALRSARPAPGRRRRVVPSLVAVGALGTAIVAVWLVRTPGTDVQARAARAVDETFFVVQQVRPARAGAFPATDISGYVDGTSGRAHLRISTPGGLAAELVVHADGRVERWVASTNTLTLSPSCVELGAACAEVLDPFDLYLRTLQSGDVASRNAGDTYRLSIRSGPVEETVVVDAETYLPRRIEWRQRGKPLSTARFLTLERQTAPVGPEAWAMSEHFGAHVVQLTAHGAVVRVLAERRVRPSSTMRWLGSAYGGYRAKVFAVTLTGGSATRIAYGPLVVWNYATVIPPSVAQARNLPAKIFAIPGAIVHASFAESGGQVADATFGDGNVAVVSSTGERDDVLRAIQRLRRPGSP